MTARTRLAAFAGAIAVTAALAAAIGFAVPAVHDDTGAHGHGSGDRDVHGSGATSGHAAHGAPREGGVPAGLAVTDSGLTMVVEDPVGRRPGSRPFLFRLVDRGGRAVTDLDVTHERRMHLIVASRDLAHYRHVHPRLRADGIWAVDLDLPEAGAYRAFADFSHAGLPRTLAADVLVDGPMRSRPLPAPADAARAGGYSAAIVARDDAPDATALTYAVRRDGAPARGITPYLGAAAHVVALRQGDLAFVHAHAEGDAADGTLDVAVHAPSPGRYRVFIQFMHDGEVRTLSHTLEVRR